MERRGGKKKRKEHRRREAGIVGCEDESRTSTGGCQMLQGDVSTPAEGVAQPPSYGPDNKSIQSPPS